MNEAKTLKTEVTYKLTDKEAYLNSRPENKYNMETYFNGLEVTPTSSSYADYYVWLETNQGRAKVISSEEVGMFEEVLKDTVKVHYYNKESGVLTYDDGSKDYLNSGGKGLDNLARVLIDLKKNNTTLDEAYIRLMKCVSSK